MIIQEKGRIYLARNFNAGYQEIRFNKKRLDGSYADGTTVEELLQILKHKFLEFERIAPSMHNRENARLMQEAMHNCHLRLQEKKQTLGERTNREDKEEDRT